MNPQPRRSWLSWATVGVLAVLCGVLALLQNHWIGEVSRAEREQLQEQLQTELGHLSREFNAEITAAVTELEASQWEVEEAGRDRAYAARYAQWRKSHERMFNRIALAVPNGGALDLIVLNLNSGEFSKQDWPADWSGLKDELDARLNHRPFEMGVGVPYDLVVSPRFGRGPDRNRPDEPERDWFLLQLNLDYVRATLLPELMHRYLAAGAAKIDYQGVVTDNGDPSRIIYESAPKLSAWVRESPDASVTLFSVNNPDGHGGRGRGQDLGPPPGMAGEPPGPPPPRRQGGFRRGGGAQRAEPGEPPGPPPMENGPPPDGRGPGPRGGRWRLLVRHEAGSLDVIVSRARWQNLATSLGVLALIIATVAALVRFSRRAQQLADAQMSFVANVSHELRTPLTVIRTAAFNLRGKVAATPEQVQRYGTLIQEESEKLSALVEQVLRFAGGRAGHAIRAREPVAIEAVIDDGLRSSGAAESNFIVEKHLENGLPQVLADPLAMKFAVQNLVENAMKYGANGKKWIGIFATKAADGDVTAVEVRVADHGPGIPADEQDHIFDPFFRGRRAVQDQVHGTGLGLSLVKNIVEAHGGTIRLESEPEKGTEFIVRIPAAPPETA